MVKNAFIFSLIVFIVFITGCDSGSSASDGATRNIAVELRSNVETAAESGISRVAVAGGDDLVMWFRSSDIEFWSTDLAGGYTDLVSDLYTSGTGDNVSVSIDLPDADETFKFEEGTVHEVDNTDADFANTVYDIVRIDIGSGSFDFSHNGSSVNYVNTVTGETGGINGNSIFLISSDLLDGSYYVSRTEFYDSKEELVASGKSEFLAEFISSEDNDIDMDGALFIPFDGIDLTEEITTVQVFFEWDITGSIDDADSDGSYEMEDRYNGTCFDFNVRVVTQS